MAAVQFQILWESPLQQVKVFFELTVTNFIESHV